MLKSQYLKIMYILNVYVSGNPIGNIYEKGAAYSAKGGDGFGHTWSSSGVAEGGVAKVMSSQSNSFAGSSSQSSSFGSSSSMSSSFGAGASQSSSFGSSLGRSLDGGTAFSTSIESGISSDIGGKTGVSGSSFGAGASQSSSFGSSLGRSLDGGTAFSTSIESGKSSDIGGNTGVNGSSFGAGASQSSSFGSSLGRSLDGGTAFSTSIESGISSDIGGKTGVSGSFSIGSDGVKGLSNGAESLSMSNFINSLKSSSLDGTNAASSKHISKSNNANDVDDIRITSNRGSIIDHDSSKERSSQSGSMRNKNSKEIGINTKVEISKTKGRKVHNGRSESSETRSSQSLTESSNRNIGSNTKQVNFNNSKGRVSVGGGGSGRSDRTFGSRSPQSTSVKRRPGKFVGIKVKFDIDTSKDGTRAGDIISKSGSSSAVSSSARSTGGDKNKQMKGIRTNDARILSGSNRGENGRTGGRTGTDKSSSSGSSRISSSKRGTDKTNDAGFQVKVDVSGGRRGVIEVIDGVDKTSPTETGTSSSHTIDGNTSRNFGINIKGGVSEGRSVLVGGNIDFDDSQTSKLDVGSEIGNVGLGLSQNTQHGRGPSGNFEIELNNGISVGNTGRMSEDFRRFGSSGGTVGGSSSKLNSRSKIFGFKAKGGFSGSGKSGLHRSAQFEKKGSFVTSSGSAGSSKSFGWSSSHSSSFGGSSTGSFGGKYAGGKSNGKINYAHS